MEDSNLAPLSHDTVHFVHFDHFLPFCPFRTVHPKRGGKWTKGAHCEEHKKACCIPGTDAEKSAHKFALRCRTTFCSEFSFSFVEPCVGDLEWRKYNGRLLSYEEISQDLCTTSSGALGVTSFCCRKNSTEGVLASTYGAELNEFPFTALLNIGGSQCGGIVYNKRFILTAAHCLVDKKTGEPKNNTGWTVKLGINVGSIQMPENDYVAEDFIVHSEYSRLSNNPLYWISPFYNDIGFLRLDRDIEFGPRVKALQIAPKEFEEMKYADQAVIVGWGTTDTFDVSDNLQKSNVLLRSDKACFADDPEQETPWFVYAERNQSLLCVGGVLDGIFSPIAGSGDSGGPAICRGEDGFGVLCGITSFGSNGTECGINIDEENCRPSVYTEVDYFRDWIEESAGSQDSKTFYRKKLYGEVVPSYKYEHQVDITSKEGKSCGGTLISGNKIVTAAQCVASVDGTGKICMDIKVRTRREASKLMPFEVSSVTILEGFERVGEPVNSTAQGFRILRTDNLYMNDLAVITLKENVPLSPNQFAQIPKSGQFPESPVFELSFPRDTSKYGGELRLREFNISGHADCQKRTGRLQNIGISIRFGDNVLCGVEKYSGGSTCDRELGGGLICKGKNGVDILCGVQIYRICEWAVPNGFLDVAQYSDWIRNVAEINVNPTWKSSYEEIFEK